MSGSKLDRRNRCRLHHQSVHNLTFWRPIARQKQTRRPIASFDPDSLLYSNASDIGYVCTLHTSDFRPWRSSEMKVSRNLVLERSGSVDHVARTQRYANVPYGPSRTPSVIRAAGATFPTHSQPRSRKYGKLFRFGHSANSKGTKASETSTRSPWGADSRTEWLPAVFNRYALSLTIIPPRGPPDLT